MDRKVCVAPMMDCTDRHERFFFKINKQERFALYRNDCF